MKLLTPGNVAFLVVLISGVLHMAAGILPRPWSTLGHIDIAELLYPTPIFRSHWPYWTFPFEYQPVVGWGSAVLSYLTGELALLVTAWIAVAALCARAAAQIIAEQVGRRRAILFWSLSPQLLLFGPTNFDALAVLSILLGTTLAARRPIAAGLAIAIGGATKLFPLAAVPPLTLSFITRGRWATAIRLSMAAAIGLLTLDLPAVIAPFSLLRYGVTPYSVATWNVDSIWFPVAAGLDVIFDPARADMLITVASVVGLVGSYLWLAVRPAPRRADPARLVWLGVAAIVFWTRLRSPQYAIWLLPAFALYVPDVRLLWFMFAGDVIAFVSVFVLRGAPRDVLSADSLPLLLAIAVGVSIRQVAVMLLILQAWRRRDDATTAA